MTAPDKDMRKGELKKKTEAYKAYEASLDHKNADRFAQWMDSQHETSFGEYKERVLKKTQSSE